MVRTNIFKTVLIAIFAVCVSGFYSCSDDDNGGDNGGNNQTKSIIGKWKVTNQNAEYGYFEFTKDNKYYIQQRVNIANNKTRTSNNDDNKTVYIIIVLGDYDLTNSIDNKFVLSLKDLGTIIVDVNESGYATITINGENYSTYNEDYNAEDDSEVSSEINREDMEAYMQTHLTEILTKNNWQIKSTELFQYNEYFEEIDPIIKKSNNRVLQFNSNGTYIIQTTDLPENLKSIGFPEYDTGYWDLTYDSKANYAEYNYYITLSHEKNEFILDEAYKYVNITRYKNERIYINNFNRIDLDSELVLEYRYANKSIGHSMGEPNSSNFENDWVHDVLKQRIEKYSPILKD